MSIEKTKFNRQALKTIQLLLLLLLALPAAAVFKYNEADNSHVIDGRLIVDSIEVRDITVHGNINASNISGDASQLILPELSGGWDLDSSLISTEDNPLDQVVLGNEAPGNRKLTVAGDLRVHDGAITVNQGSGLLAHDNASYGLIFDESGGFASTVFNSPTSIVSVIDSTGNDSNANKFSWTSGNALNGGQDLMTLDEQGDLGIFNANPQEDLDVNGNIKASGFIGDGSQLTNVPSNAGEMTLNCFTNDTSSSLSGDLICSIARAGFHCIQSTDASLKPLSCDESSGINERRKVTCCGAQLV